MKSTETYATPPDVELAGAEPALLLDSIDSVENVDTNLELENDSLENDDCTARCARCLQPIESEDGRLVQGCLNGDQQAWGRLIDKYKRLIFSIPFKYGATAEDAADVFQAVCIEVFNSLPQLKNPDSLRSWLITVAVRQSYRWKQKQSNHVELDAMEPELAEEIATAPETMMQIQQEQIVRDVVDQLPPRCAELVKMLFFEQPPLPYAEVARRLGLATGSIGFVRGRCLVRLRKILLEAGFNGFRPSALARDRRPGYSVPAAGKHAEF
ncbi:MAG: sigma-70 family RNA polymerase sigma factor [Acidobacteriia bacterium]|nr:sigma-70 family RNA polymerase sigma factor [Terriglobia bacterium]